MLLASIAAQFLGIKMPAGPKMVVSPFVCCQPADYKALFPNPSDVTISGKSVLVIKGKGSVVIKVRMSEN